MYILLFALLLVGPAYAHVGDRIYSIPEISDADLDRFDLHDTSGVWCGCSTNNSSLWCVTCSAF